MNGRLWKVKEKGRPFPDFRLVSSETSYWWWWWLVELYCQPQSQSVFSELRIKDLSLGYGTCIWDLGLGLGLDN